MDDLVQWLRAQLDEDKRLALDAGGDRWSHHGGTLMWHTERGPRDAVVAYQGSAVGCVAITNPVHGDGAPEALHIAEHDPARVLREIDAKRQLLDKYAEVAANDVNEVEYAHGWANALGEAVRLLALPYADRPGYRDQWRP